MKTLDTPIRIPSNITERPTLRPLMSRGETAGRREVQIYGPGDNLPFAPRISSRNLRTDSEDFDATISPNTVTSTGFVLRPNESIQTPTSATFSSGSSSTAGHSEDLSYFPPQPLKPIPPPVEYSSLPEIAEIMEPKKILSSPSILSDT